MSREVVYLPEVSRDFFEAFGFYEVRSSQTALHFEEAFGLAEAEAEQGVLIRAFAQKSRDLPVY